MNSNKVTFKYKIYTKTSVRKIQFNIDHKDSTILFADATKAMAEEHWSDSMETETAKTIQVLIRCNLLPD